MKKGKSWKKNKKIQKKRRKNEKEKEECIVDYCCNPQCIWVWGNNDFSTPFSYMYN